MSGQEVFDSAGKLLGLIVMHHVASAFDAAFGELRIRSPVLVE